MAGFYPRLDGPLMRLVDVMLAFPGILLAIAIVGALGLGLISVIVAIGTTEIPGLCAPEPVDRPVAAPARVRAGRAGSRRT